MYWQTLLPLRPQTIQIPSASLLARHHYWKGPHRDATFGTDFSSEVGYVQPERELRSSHTGEECGGKWEDARTRAFQWLSEHMRLSYTGSWHGFIRKGGGQTTAQSVGESVPNGPSRRLSC